MKISIVHTSKGGAFSVAKSYAFCFDSDVVVVNSSSRYIRLLLFLAKNRCNISVLVFHSPTLALKFAVPLFLFLPQARFYCLEHFVVSQILRDLAPAKRILIASVLILYPLLNIRPISLDRLSARNRCLSLKPLGRLGKHPLVIHNPLKPIPISNIREVPLPLEKKYDLVWAAGLSKQKLWPRAFALIEQVTLIDPHLRVAICTYDEFDTHTTIRASDKCITLVNNRQDWVTLSDFLLFTSSYEGYPLTIIEAIRANMFIFAISNPFLKYQLLRYYPHSSWHSSSLSNEFLAHSIVKSIHSLRHNAIGRKPSLDTVNLLDRHSPLSFTKEVSTL